VGYRIGLEGWEEQDTTIATFLPHGLYFLLGFPKFYLFLCRHCYFTGLYKSVSKSLWTGCWDWELQMVQLSATRCSCIAIFWVVLMSFATITLCVASQWVFIVVSIYFIINSVWKLLGTPSYFYSGFSKLCMFLPTHCHIPVVCFKSVFLGWTCCFPNTWYPWSLYQVRRIS
jgi:hypothetical protein